MALSSRKSSGRTRKEIDHRRAKTLLGALASVCATRQRTIDPSAPHDQGNAGYDYRAGADDVLDRQAHVQLQCPRWRGHLGCGSKKGRDDIFFLALRFSCFESMKFAAEVSAGIAFGAAWATFMAVSVDLTYQ